MAPQWLSPFFPHCSSRVHYRVRMFSKRVEGRGEEKGRWARSTSTSLFFPMADKILLFSEDTPVNFQFRSMYQEIRLSWYPLEIIPGLKRFHSLRAPKNTLTTCFLCQPHPNIVLDKISTSRLFTLLRELRTVLPHNQLERSSSSNLFSHPLWPQKCLYFLSKYQDGFSWCGWGPRIACRLAGVLSSESGCKWAHPSSLIFVHTNPPNCKFYFQDYISKNSRRSCLCSLHQPDFLTSVEIVSVTCRVLDQAPNLKE